MHLDLTVSLGNLLAVLGLILAGTTWATKITVSLDALRNSLRDLAAESRSDRQALHQRIDTLERTGCELAGLCDLTKQPTLRRKGKG